MIYCSRIINAQPVIRCNFIKKVKTNIYMNDFFFIENITIFFFPQNITKQIFFLYTILCYTLGGPHINSVKPRTYAGEAVLRCTHFTTYNLNSRSRNLSLLLKTSTPELFFYNIVMLHCSTLYIHAIWSVLLW